MKPQIKLSIIIPVYNEANTLLPILLKIQAVELIHDISKELIIINDGSIDHSKTIIFEFKNSHPKSKIIYIENDENLGKGTSIRRGFKKATGQYTIVQDADLEYDPQDYNNLLAPLLNGSADVVYGSRFLDKTSKNYTYFTHYYGNIMLTKLSNLFTRFELSDMETCYKLFKTETLMSISLSEKGYGFEPEITAKLSRLKQIRLTEVKVSYCPRTFKDGKKIQWTDAVRAMYCILKYNFLG